MRNNRYNNSDQLYQKNYLAGDDINKISKYWWVTAFQSYAWSNA